MRRKVRPTLILSALVQPRSVTALGAAPPLLLPRPQQKEYLDSVNYLPYV